MMNKLLAGFEKLFQPRANSGHGWPDEIMHSLMCLISGAQRKPRFSQATLKRPRKDLFNSLIRLAPVLTLLLISSSAFPDDTKKIPVTDETFKCLSQMTPVRGFFVDNLLGRLKATVDVANSPSGGRYPPGSVVQLIPTEVMVKHQEGWNPATKDWEFFELEVSEAGSKIKVRGATDVVNRFGGNCFGCHVAAKPEWDLVCEKDHGCAPLPIPASRILAIQQADPRCKSKQPAAK